MPALTRIAPTPSGYLHAGNAINFLLIDRVAKEFNARVLLRIDDLDADRVRPEYLEDVFDSLHWLGIKWELGPSDPEDHLSNWSQGLRLGRYHELLKQLRDAGVLYGCTCTRGRLRDIPGPYPGFCRDEGIDLDDPSAAWRIRVPSGCLIEIPSLGADGPVIDLSTAIGDVVLRQRPIQGNAARPAYQVASLADDVDRGIGIIVRGEDLLPSTAIQLHLARLLGMKEFLQVRFMHHPLILDLDGRKFSKSEGASSLKAMRELGAGIEPLQEQAAELFMRSIPERS